MSTILELMQRLKNCNVNHIAHDSIYDTRSDLIERQKEQLFAGRTADESFITPPYADRTIIWKIKKGQPTDRVTLKDTEDFYKSIIVDVRDITYVIDATDWKTPLLLNKYGQSIFGLGGVFIVGYRNDVRPIFYNKISESLKLKFG